MEHVGFRSSWLSRALTGMSAVSPPWVLELLVQAHCQACAPPPPPVTFRETPSAQVSSILSRELTTDISRVHSPGRPVSAILEEK